MNERGPNVIPGKCRMGMVFCLLAFADLSLDAAGTKQLQATSGTITATSASFEITNAPVAFVPAFRGAEGAGARSVGGRGGDVYYVTTLTDNSSSGSLRYGIANAPSTGRTICFKVSGNIVLNSTLTINKPKITIAGQTAPGDGVCLQNYSFNIAASDVIVRHVRTRLGTNAWQESDAMWINAGTNIMVDHLSASWSVDETLSCSRYVANLTVQNCFITESLRNSIHVKGAHGYGGIISSSTNATYTYHHNLYAHNSSRNPRVGSDLPEATLRLDFRNNLIFDWGFYATYSGDTNENVQVNYVNNYLVAGPSTTRLSAFNGGAVTTHIYQSGNMLDINKNGRVDGSDTGWGMFTGAFTRTNAPFDVPEMPVESAAVACQRVIAQSGATPWRRDAIDQRVAVTFFKQSGQTIDFINLAAFEGEYVTNNVSGTNYVGVNPWPMLSASTAPVDTDSDGMPDYWELAVGLNRSLASDRNITNTATGFTRLEEYLNWLADAHALCDRNGFADVDLRTATGGSTNHVFAVNAATNGTVALLADGFTARFTAAANTNGAGNFTFTVTDPATSVSFGPVNYSILITTTNAPVINVAPVLPSIADKTINELSLLTVTNTATDTNPITYQLLNAPAGAVISTNGIITWTPTEAQGPGTNVIVTVASDGALSTTNAFTVVVTEVNSAPVLDAIGSGSLTSGMTWTFTSTATDADLPANTFTFQLLNAPTGAALDATNGLFIWRPTVAQGGTTNRMSVVVTDNGTPALSATQSFSVQVLTPASPALHQAAVDGRFSMDVAGDAGPDYRILTSSNLLDWAEVFTTNPPALPFNWSDPAPTDFRHRFYRVLLGP